MKGGGGYSLVEVVVVIGILATLAAIGTINYREYSRRYRAESQTRMLYQELLKARSDALYLRRDILLKIYPQRLEVYSSSSNRPGVAPARSFPLSFPLRCKKKPDSAGAIPVVFDSRGIALTSCTICLEGESGSAVDSVVIYKTRVRIGKNGDPTVCESENIATR